MRKKKAGSYKYRGRSSKLLAQGLAQKVTGEAARRHANSKSRRIIIRLLPPAPGPLVLARSDSLKTRASRNISRLLPVDAQPPPVQTPTTTSPHTAASSRTAAPDRDNRENTHATPVTRRVHPDAPRRATAGFLIPPGWHEPPPSSYALEVVAILMGFHLGVCVFAAFKAIGQTRRCWRRLGGKLTTYIAMVWISWACGIVQATINYLYLKDEIEPSFWIFFGEVLVWAVQIQTLMQIMVNRISLIMYNDRNALRLKIAVLIVITILNIGVMVIWVPAQLGVNHTFYTTNQVWHRVEKSIFLVVDAALNVYFIHLVRSELIQPGLAKYKSLYRFNLAMVVLSITLDVAVIGVVTVPDAEVYVEFRALTYTIKLYIEMTIAEFIARLVRSTDAAARQHESYVSELSESRQDNLGWVQQQDIEVATSNIESSVPVVRAESDRQRDPGSGSGMAASTSR